MSQANKDERINFSSPNDFLPLYQVNDCILSSVELKLNAIGFQVESAIESKKMYEFIDKDVIL